MSNQSELAQLASVFAGSALSNRNVITNGSFIINQRGVATTNLTSGGVWFADRFFAQTGGTSIAVSGSRSTDVPSGTAFLTSIKFDTTTAATATDHFTRFTTRLEGYEAKRIGVSTSGNKITLSFWVKSTRTGTHTVGLSTGYRAGTNYAQAGITLSYTINSASTWEYKSIAFDSYDTGGSAAWNVDNNIGLEITFVVGQGSGLGNSTALDTWQDFASIDYVNPKSTSDNNNWGTSTSDEWFICGVQLEVGDTATPFEHRSYGDELARCQRYYQITTYQTNAVTGTYYSFYNRFYGCQVPFLAMRTTPSVSYNHTAGAFYWVNPGVNAYSANSATGFNYSAHKGTSGMGAVIFDQTRPAGGLTPTDFNSYRLEASIDFLLDAEL